MSATVLLKNIEDFCHAVLHTENILGMNRRNLEFVYGHNDRRDFPLADDKLRTKEAMMKVDVPVPRTYRVYRNFFELKGLKEDLAPFEDFVIKPAQGRAGSGIIVITGKEAQGWLGPSNRRYGLEELRRHIADILFGAHSQDQADRVIIEERIRQHPQMELLSPLGLADVRLILFHNEPLLAMSRIPTRNSGGRANLHQGAVGVSVDLDSGLTRSAVFNRRPAGHHPDTGAALLGRQIPCWEEVVRLGIRAADALPLKYLGVDISIAEGGPVLLEVNARPGLEIQNVSGTGLKRLLEKRQA